MSFYWGDAYSHIEAALQLSRLGFNNLAVLQSMASIATRFQNPALAQVFDANSGVLRIAGHIPKTATFDVTEAVINGKKYDVQTDDVLMLPYGTLKKFHVPDLKEKRSRVFEIAPMSGHPAPTILENSVKEMVKHHDVFMFDWHDPKHIPTEFGEFGLDNYMHYLIQAFKVIGPDAHVVADCQPGFPLVGALSYMEAINDPNLPLTATFKGSPLNTALNPTDVSLTPKIMTDLYGSKEAAVEGFKDHFLQTVSKGYAGEGQKVVHGSIQLMNFYRLAPVAHMNGRLRYWWQRALDIEPAARERHEKFYKNYDTVTDLPGKYLLETFDGAFLNQRLANGTLFFTHPETGEVHHVDPANITRVSTMVVEGRKDTITGQYQTADILNMMTNLDPNLKRYMLGPTGHYGLFDGTDYRDVTRVVTTAHIHEAEERVLGIKRETSDPPVDLKAYQYNILDHPELLEQRPEYDELAA